MKTGFTKIVTIGILVVLFFSGNLFAQRIVKSTGIGLRATHWQMTSDPTRVTVLNRGEYTAVDAGSGGIWLYLVSRMNYNVLFELSIGAVGKVKEETVYYTNTDVDVFAVTPLLFGFRFELFSPESHNALQPYFSFGAGPYWISTIQVTDNLYEEEVTIQTKLKRGGYFGGGANFMLTDWLAFNFDLKYHFIDFNVKHEYSGFELGFGIGLMWGRYKL